MGNVRYGKAFRTKDNLSLIEEHITFRPGARVLDVGANRGAFCKAFLKEHPESHLIALEPDARVIDDYKDISAIELVNERIENVTYDDEVFDLTPCDGLEVVTDRIKWPAPY